MCYRTSFHDRCTIYKTFSIYLFADISESTDETLAQYSTTLDDSAFINSKIQAQLYTLSKKEGFNVLAVGHHLDDLAEEFVKSIFQSGKLQTMKALSVVK